MQAIGTAAYQQTQAGPTQSEPQSGPQQGGTDQGGDDVVDGEFHEA